MNSWHAFLNGKPLDVLKCGQQTALQLAKSNSFISFLWVHYLKLYSMFTYEMRTVCIYCVTWSGIPDNVWCILSQPCHSVCHFSLNKVAGKHIFNFFLPCLSKDFSFITHLSCSFPSRILRKQTSLVNEVLGAWITLESKLKPWATSCPPPVLQPLAVIKYL